MINYIVAVDPGEMCGWAIARFEEDHLKTEYINAGQSPADDWEDWCVLNVYEGCLLVVEKFTITARTAQMSQQPRALETIGVMRFLARRAGAQFHMQTPSAAKRFVTDQQLHKVGLWKPGQDHARDALRHLILAITTHGTGQAREEMLQSLA